MELDLLWMYLVFWLVNTAIFALLTLALNLHWGYTGLFNVGVAGFFAVGAYGSVIMTTTSSVNHLGGFNLPVTIGIVGGGLIAAIVALLVGIPVLRLGGDYLAIATLGVAQVIKMVITNEGALGNGVRGIANIPQPLRQLSPWDFNLSYLVLVLVVLLACYLLLERMIKSPWGRCLMAIREDEMTTACSGKNVISFKLQSFALGAFVMGLAGGLYAHFMGVLSPVAVTDDMTCSFLVWAMLIIGGSGNNRGAILGAVLLQAIWSCSEIFTDSLPAALSTQSGALRSVLIGTVWVLMIIYRPDGLLPARGRSQLNSS